MYKFIIFCGEKYNFVSRTGCCDLTVESEFTYIFFMQKLLKILILEDSPADAGLIERELKKGGIIFDSKITGNKAEFSNALEEFQPDVILSDHSLPGFDSIEALQMSRAKKIDAPFILVTGAVSEEFAADCIKSGADDYILKDKLTRLPSAVLSALEKTEANRQKQIAIRNLEEQNVFMNLLLKSIPVAQYVSKLVSHEVTFMSKNIFSFSGYHPEQFVSNPMFWFNQIHPDDLANVKSNLSQLIFDNERSYEYRWRVSDQTYRWIYDRAKIIKNEDGTSFIAGAMIDITLRKEAEEKLALKNKELNTFIYRSTHDLRGPLVTILGLTNVARDEDELHELRNYIMMIDECTHKLDDVLLSLITTISIKDTDVVQQEIDFNKMVSSILDDCKVIEGYDEIKVFVDVRVHSRCMMEDFAVHNILKNIIENSVKYRSRNIDNAFISIFVYDVPASNILKIIVKDNGMGINAKIKDKVFDMFFRGTMICKGSGLGLYIVRNAVEKLQGTIALMSTENVGTTVEVSLPLNISHKMSHERPN